MRRSSNLALSRVSQALEPDELLTVQVLAAERCGAGAVARVQAAAYVSAVSLQNAAMLSQAANEAFKTSPLGEPIYNAIVMAFGTVATAEIQALGLQGTGQH